MDFPVGVPLNPGSICMNSRRLAVGMCLRRVLLAGTGGILPMRRHAVSPRTTCF